MYVPTRDLVAFWREYGAVHTSLTSLTHGHTGKAFSVVWSRILSDGVESHDNFARDFNQGIKYPNIRMSGLADFDHLRAVEKPAEFPAETNELRMIDGHPLSHREGCAAFSRSISEVLIVAMHAALTGSTRLTGIW